MTARIILGETPDSGVLYLVRGDGAQLALEVDQDWTGVTVTLGWGARGDATATTLDTGTVTVDAGESLVTWALTEEQSTARQLHSHFRVEANGKTIVSGPVFVTDGWVGGAGADGQVIGRVISGPAGSSDPQDIADAVEDYLTTNPPSGVTDHGALTGLGDDDHTQYHNDARGDVRYYTKSQVDASLAGKANTSHGHAIGDVTNLQATLDGKAATSHTHAPSDVTGTAVIDSDPRLSNARTPTAHSHVIADTTGLQTALDGKAASSHTHTLAQVTDAGGAASLNVGTTAGTVAAGDHTHELDDLDATGATDGHVLTADGAGGAAWEAPAGGGSTVVGPRINSTQYVNPESVATTQGVANGSLHLIPIRTHAPQQWSKIRSSITTAGTGTLRLGIYGTDASGNPGDLIVDAGTRPATSTGVADVTFSPIALDPGWYWLACLVEGTGITMHVGQNTLQTGAALQAMGHHGLVGIDSGTYYLSGIIASGVASGALPATAPSAGWNRFVAFLALGAA